MDKISIILMLVQLIFTVVAGIYFYNCLKNQNTGKRVVSLDSKKEAEKLQRLRAIKLTEPLSEKTRPERLEEIVGQESGIRALKATLCSESPQHIIIYGPPGVGKTAAARIALEEAKKCSRSPFKSGAAFVEMDATILQFDERSIADPLIGSVHDPIYQGAGAFGSAGIPQPKPGAVTKAHGGVLFIDEIGELHPIQMNKLLKVLEDRKVFLSSSYYSEEDTNIPSYIHDIFKNGLPADFRLIGATTRLPEEIPPALRSRCREIHFKRLSPEHISKIALKACNKAGMDCELGAEEIVAKYAFNGRDAVNIIQMAVSFAMEKNRKCVFKSDIEDVLEILMYTPVFEKKADAAMKNGSVYGLAVTGASFGTILEIEAEAFKNADKKGELKVTGIVEEEEIKGRQGNMKRKSTAKSSVENVLTVIKRLTGIDCREYDIHVNFPGGIPVDGPSAGIAVFCAVYSAILQRRLKPYIAMTGEIGIKGDVLPVGGVADKIEGAIRAGIKTIIIPKENWQNNFKKYNAEIIAIEKADELFQLVFEEQIKKETA